MDNREVINDVLVNLFNEILRLEEEAIITDKYKDISNNDMHIIEAVGLGGGNMSSIAAKLKITVGSLTTSMNSLVKKGYVKRERSEKDRHSRLYRLHWADIRVSMSISSQADVFTSREILSIRL